MEPNDHPTPEAEDQAAPETSVPQARPVDEPATVAYAPSSYSGWLALGIPLARPVDSRLSMTPGLSRLRALIEILLVVPAAIVGGVMGYLFTTSLQPADERWLAIGDSMGTGLGAALGCLLIVWLGHGRLSTIGLTTRNLLVDVCLGMATWVGLYMGLLLVMIVIVILHPELLDQRWAAQKAIEENIPPMSMSGIFALCLFVAVYEELVFRGFLLTRLYAIVRRWWAAVPLGALLFGILHVYEGVVAVGVVTLLGLAMSLLFVWRKSLAAPIAMHLLHNFVMFSLLRFASQTWK